MGRFLYLPLHEWLIVMINVGKYASPMDAWDKLGNLFNNISQVLQSYSMGTGTMVGGLISYITVVDF